MKFHCVRAHTSRKSHAKLCAPVFFLFVVFLAYLNVKLVLLPLVNDSKEDLVNLLLSLPFRSFGSVQFSSIRMETCSIHASFTHSYTFHQLQLLALVSVHIFVYIHIHRKNYVRNPRCVICCKFGSIFDIGSRCLPESMLKFNSTHKCTHKHIPSWICGLDNNVWYLSIDRSSTWLLATESYCNVHTYFSVRALCAQYISSDWNDRSWQNYNENEYKMGIKLGNFTVVHSFPRYIFSSSVFDWVLSVTKRIPFIMWVEVRTSSSILTCDRKHYKYHFVLVIFFSFALWIFFFISKRTKEFEWVFFYLLLYTNNDDDDDNDNGYNDSTHKRYNECGCLECKLSYSLK